MEQLIDQGPVDWSDIVKPYTETKDFYIPTDSEALTQTVNPQEAIECYRNRYPQEAMIAGMVSPQDATAMLVRISDQYSGVMSNDEKMFIETQAVEVVHEIVDNPDDDPTLPCLYHIVDVIDMIAEDVPAEILASTEKDLKKAIQTVKEKSVEGEDMVQNIELALKFYDNPDNAESLGSIVTNLEVKKMNQAQDVVEAKNISNDDDPDATAYYQRGRAA
jgi:hypothetical protein